MEDNKRGGGKEREKKEKKNEFYETSVNNPSLFYCWTSFCRLYLQICESFLLSIFKRHHFSCQYRNWNKLIHFLYAAEWANVKHKLSPIVTMEGTVIVIWQSVPLLAPLTARYDKEMRPVSIFICSRHSSADSMSFCWSVRYVCTAKFVIWKTTLFFLPMARGIHIKLSVSP